MEASMGWVACRYPGLPIRIVSSCACSALNSLWRRSRPGICLFEGGLAMCSQMQDALFEYVFMVRSVALDGDRVFWAGAAERERGRKTCHPKKSKKRQRNRGILPAALPWTQVFQQRSRLMRSSRSAPPPQFARHFWYPVPTLSLIARSSPNNIISRTKSAARNFAYSLTYPRPKQPAIQKPVYSQSRQRLPQTTFQLAHTFSFVLNSYSLQELQNFKSVKCENPHPYLSLCIHTCSAQIASMKLNSIHVWRFLKVCLSLSLNWCPLSVRRGARCSRWTTSFGGRLTIYLSIQISTFDGSNVISELGRSGSDYCQLVQVLRIHWTWSLEMRQILFSYQGLQCIRNWEWFERSCSAFIRIKNYYNTFWKYEKLRRILSYNDITLIYWLTFYRFSECLNQQ